VTLLKETQFRNYLKKRKLANDEIDLSIDCVKEFESYLEKKKLSFETAGFNVLKEYITLMNDEEKNLIIRLLAIARYCHVIKKDEYYIHLASILGARNVLPDIGERISAICGKEIRNKIFEDFELPPLGSSPENYPRITQMILDKMTAELPTKICKEILTWNYHKIPVESFNEKKKRFKKSKTIDQYLINEHKRFIEELETCMKEEKIWYEQKITPAVLEFVQNNQEICTGVKQGNKIYISKIPYDPQQYFEENDPCLKAYYACHCPLVRSALLDEKIKILSIFCYCSSGFEKTPFDAIFEENVEVELLESVLNGDGRCRFAIKIPEDKMK
jgi:hypothetical protein